MRGMINHIVYLRWLLIGNNTNDVVHNTKEESYHKRKTHAKDDVTQNPHIEVRLSHCVSHMTQSIGALI